MLAARMIVEKGTLAVLIPLAAGEVGRGLFVRTGDRLGSLRLEDE